MISIIINLSLHNHATLVLFFLLQGADQHKKFKELKKKLKPKVQALLDSNWPLKPRYVLVQVIHILVSINSLNNWLGTFDKWSKQITLGDHLNNSHNLFSWLSIDIINVRWKLMLLRVNKYYKKWIIFINGTTTFC